MVEHCFYCGKSAKCSGLRYFHKFPTDPKACEMWKRKIGLAENFDTKRLKLCSDHFTEDCYLKGTNYRGRLAEGSVPTKFGDFIQKCVCCDNIKIRGSKKSFRKFPLKNAELLKKWLEAIGNEHFYPNERSLICDDHFAKNCFSNNNGYLRLKVDTFPTIFSTGSDDANRTGQIGVTDSLISESEVTHSIAPIENCNLTSQINNDSLMIPVKNRKRLSTEELPDLKYFKLDENQDKHSIMDDSFSIINTGNYHDPEDDISTKESVECMGLKIEAEGPSASVTSSSQNAEKVPEVPSTPRRIQLTVQHDHHYQTSPRDLKRRYRAMRTKLAYLQRDSKVQKQHIRRLKKTITTLSEIVSELLRTKELPEDALACLDSVVETDMFLSS